MTSNTGKCGQSIPNYSNAFIVFYFIRNKLFIYNMVYFILKILIVFSDKTLKGIRIAA